MSREKTTRRILTFDVSYLPGKTREQAFRIGNEMADAITRQNPVPIKLKFEKVGFPHQSWFPTRAEVGLPSLRPDG